MNLLELQQAVNEAVEMCGDMERLPEDIPVTIQIDDVAHPHHGYVQTDRDLQVHYDGDCNASGCVLGGWRDTRDVEKILQEAGYKTVSGAEAVKKAIADNVDKSLPLACSGHGVFPDGTKCKGCVDCS